MVHLAWGAVTVKVCGHLGLAAIAIIHILDIDAHFPGYVALFAGSLAI